MPTYTSGHEIVPETWRPRFSRKQARHQKTLKFPQHNLIRRRHARKRRAAGGCVQLGRKRIAYISYKGHTDFLEAVRIYHGWEWSIYDGELGRIVARGKTDINALALARPLRPSTESTGMLRPPY